MNSVIRWDPFRNVSNLQAQVNRLFESTLPGRGSESSMTTWAPAVDIYETENELVLKADLPDVNERTSTSASRTTRSRFTASGSSSRK